MSRKTVIRWAFSASLAVFSLMLAPLSFAQDQPMGDIARQARAEKSTEHHATKTLTDDDLGAHPVSEKDEPIEVVARGSHAFVEDTAHRCTTQLTNNSGPGSFAETVMEFAGPDRMHMLNRQTGNNASLTEFIMAGTSAYHRSGAGPWQEEPGEGTANIVSAMHHMPESLAMASSSRDLKLMGRDVVGGVLTFLYEMQYHPGQVPTRDTTLKIWIGVNDGLPHRFQMRQAENTYKPPIINDEITTCSYGNVPEIKAPI